MNYVSLGNTGLKVSQVSFGGIPIQRADAANTMAVVDALEARGINFIDTARGYTVSEEYLGAALEGRRDKFIIATKSMSRDAEGMTRDIGISLSNLRTDYIDLYQIHNLPEKDFDKVFGPGGAYEALCDAKAAGKVRHIGATAHNADVLRRLVEEYGDKIETLMFPYNIVETQGHDILAAARKKGIGTIAMKPMAGGNLDDWNLALRFIAAAGVIDAPILGQVFAAADGPATLNGRELTPRSTRRPEDALVLSGFPGQRMGARFPEYAAHAIRTLEDSVSAVRHLGSAALELAYVAAGWADATALTAINSWDVAAGFHILRRAGGSLRTWPGEEVAERPDHLQPAYVACSGQGRLEVLDGLQDELQALRVGS